MRRELPFYCTNPGFELAKATGIQGFLFIYKQVSSMKKGCFRMLIACILLLSATDAMTKWKVEPLGLRFGTESKKLVYLGKNEAYIYALSMVDKIGWDILQFDRNTYSCRKFSPPELAFGDPGRFFPYLIDGFVIRNTVFIRFGDAPGAEFLHGFLMLKDAENISKPIGREEIKYSEGNDYYTVFGQETIQFFNERTTEIGKCSYHFPESKDAIERYKEPSGDQQGTLYHPSFTPYDKKSYQIGAMGYSKAGKKTSYDFDLRCTNITHLLAEKASDSLVWMYTYYTDEPIDHFLVTKGALEPRHMPCSKGMIVAAFDPSTQAMKHRYVWDLDLLLGYRGESMVYRSEHFALYPRQVFRYWDGFVTVGEEGYYADENIIHVGKIHVCYFDPQLKLQWSVLLPKNSVIYRGAIENFDFPSGFSMVKGNDQLHFVFEDVAPEEGIKNPVKAEMLDKLSGKESHVAFTSAFRYKKFAVLTTAALDKNGKITYGQITESRNHEYLIDHKATLQEKSGAIVVLVKFVISEGYQFVRLTPG
jgi:hypothetical protein